MSMVLRDVLAWLKVRSDTIGRLIDGTPVVIFERGDWHEKPMRCRRGERPHVMAAARQSGLERMEQVRYAMVERDGKVSIIPDER